MNKIVSRVRAEYVAVLLACVGAGLVPIGGILQLDVMLKAGIAIFVSAVILLAIVRKGGVK